MHDTNSTRVATVTNSGALYLFDRDTKSLLVDNPSAHDFEIWYVSISEINPPELFTCSDDGKFKLHDTRVEGGMVL